MLSILDNDLYTFTQQQAILHHYPEADVEFKFKCRTEGIDFRPIFDKIKNDIHQLKTLKLDTSESEYLSNLDFFKPDYIRFLELFRFNPDYVKLTLQEDNSLDIRIKGPWLHVMPFEVPILSIISEVYSKFHYPIVSSPEGPVVNALEKLTDKIRLLEKYDSERSSDIPQIKFSDFGTRRRFSFEVQDALLSKMVREFQWLLVGTSNVYFAKKYRIKPIGTMAHQWIQAHQQLGSRIIDSQKVAFETWVKEYRGQLGIALTDTINLSSFLNDFDLYFSKLFDGVRHDSGSPFSFGARVIEHYLKFGINLNTKTLVFSDGLTFEKMTQLHYEFANKINVAFGIGTNFTNDVPLTKALQIVIKMIKCNGFPVAKISDDPSGKSMCEDQEYENYVKQVFGDFDNYILALYFRLLWTFNRFLYTYACALFIWMCGSYRCGYWIW